MIEAVGIWRNGETAKQPRWIVFSDDLPKLGSLATCCSPGSVEAAAARLTEWG
ncbi:MAG: hypothetical protein KIT60_05115 [Burkholderiaceae bacterium]|nr:hypothetical protein [Burkholderiaceae bacterium]